MSTLDSNGIMFLEETDPISPFQTLINGMQAATSAVVGDLQEQIENAVSIQRFEGAQVMSTLSGGSDLAWANAIKITDSDGNGIVSFQFSISAATEGGSQNTSLAQLVSELTPNVAWTPWYGTHPSHSLAGLISEGGVVSLRWDSQNTVRSLRVYGGAAYPVFGN